jgi:hypothetical protein
MTPRSRSGESADSPIVDRSSNDRLTTLLPLARRVRFIERFCMCRADEMV